ncbi:MAG: LURP-one-related family protein [Chloroflexota bacterium]
MMFGSRKGNTDVPKRYQLHQKLITLGDDFYIEDENGDQVFHVDGKLFAIRETLSFNDMDGNVLANIQQRLLRIRDTMEIEDSDGKTLAVVKKALFTLLTQRFDVTVEDGPDLEIQGSILDHEYNIKADGRKVAEVSKRWFSLRDSYGVEIEPGQNDVIILAITVAIDMMREEPDSKPDLNPGDND